MNTTGSGPARPAGSSVLCLGDVMVDVITRLTGPLEPGSDRPGRTELHAGGSAMNTAAWLGAAGLPAGVIGRVGDDLLGRWSREQLGGLAAGLGVDPRAPTGTCVVLVDTDGERTMIPDAGANGELRPEHVDPASIAAARHLHVSAYALFGPARDAAVSALRAAGAAGVPVTVGAASAAPLRTLGPATFFELVGSDVLLLANRAEAAVLTGVDDPQTAADLLAQRVRAAVVTDGAQRAFYAGSDGRADAPAHSVPVIDTTGAGDAFAAGVIAARLAGCDPAEALRAGHALAAQACLQAGARPPR